MAFRIEQTKKQNQKRSEERRKELEAREARWQAAEHERRDKFNQRTRTEAEAKARREALLRASESKKRAMEEQLAAKKKHDLEITDQMAEQARAAAEQRVNRAERVKKQAKAEAEAELERRVHAMQEEAAERRTRVGLGAAGRAPPLAGRRSGAGSASAAERARREEDREEAIYQEALKRANIIAGGGKAAENGGASGPWAQDSALDGLMRTALVPVNMDQVVSNLKSDLSRERATSCPAPSKRQPGTSTPASLHNMLSNRSRERRVAATGGGGGWLPWAGT